MANSIAFRYTSSLMGKMTHQGYDRSNNLRAARVDNTAIIAYDFSIYSERLLSLAEVESKMKAVAERVLPDFAPDGGNETTSAWWAWGDDGSSIFPSGRPPQPVEVNADTVDPRAAWVRRLPGRLQPSSHFFKGVATTETLVRCNCLINVLVEALKCTSQKTYEKLYDAIRDELIAAGRGLLGYAINPEIDGVSLWILERWAAMRPGVQLTVFNTLLQRVLFVPRTTSGTANRSICLFVEGDHVYMATDHTLKHYSGDNVAVGYRIAPNDPASKMALQRPLNKQFRDPRLIKHGTDTGSAQYETGVRTGGDSTHATKPAMVSRVLPVVTDRCSGQLGDYVLDVSNIGFQLAQFTQIGIDEEVDNDTVYANTPAFWASVFGDAPMGTEFAVVATDLMPLRLALIQAYGQLCCESSRKPSRASGGKSLVWRRTNLVGFELIVVDGKGVIQIEYVFNANPSVHLVESTRSIWQPYLTKYRDGSRAPTLPQVVAAFMEKTGANLPMGGFHPSTYALWGRYRSSAFRACVETVEPEFNDHGRLLTIDYRAQFKTALGTMAQDIPVSSEDDLFVPVHELLTASTELSDDTWYVVEVDTPGLPFLGMTSIVFASLLRRVVDEDPGRRVTILYKQVCSQVAQRQHVCAMPARFEELAGGNKKMEKQAVAQWVGSLSRFRQPEEKIMSKATESMQVVSQCWQPDTMRVTGGDDEDSGMVYSTQSHVLFVPASHVPDRDDIVEDGHSVVYDLKCLSREDTVANQSQLQIQLAVHSMSYLMLWDLEKRLCGLGARPIAYATDSITAVLPSNVNVEALRGDPAALTQWLGFVCAGAQFHAESAEHTRGTLMDRKRYVNNTVEIVTPSGYRMQPCRAFSKNFADKLFDNEEALVASANRLGRSVEDVKKGAWLVCPDLAWKTEEVGDEPIETTVDRVVAALEAKSGVYVGAMGGGGKTYLLAHVVKRWQKTKNILVTSFTHDGASALQAEIGKVCPSFDSNQIQTLDAALRRSSRGFSRVMLPCQVLIVDEVSMLSVTHLSYLTNLLELQPSVRVILAGDMLQHLSPSEAFRFESPLFHHVACGHRIELTYNRRLLSIPENTPLRNAIAVCRRILSECGAQSDGGRVRDAMDRLDLRFIPSRFESPTLHLARTNHAIKHLNDRMMREAARRAVPSEDHVFPLVSRAVPNIKGQDLVLFVGLKLVVRVSIKKIGLWNKAAYDVVAMDETERKVTLEWRGGKKMVPPKPRQAKRVAHNQWTQGKQRRRDGGRKKARNGGVHRFLDDEADDDGDEEEHDEECEDDAEDFDNRTVQQIRKVRMQIDILEQQGPRNYYAGKGSKNRGHFNKTRERNLTKARKQLAELEAQLEAQRAVRVVEEDMSVSSGSSSTDAAPQWVCTYDQLALHFAPRYAMTSYGVQGHTLDENEFPWVMLHELETMDVRAAHVLLGRVRHINQLVRPGGNQKVVCHDPNCKFRTMPGFVYEIVQRSTGRVYVGQTLHNPPERRFEEHKAESVNHELRRAMDASHDVNADFTFTVVGRYEVSKEAGDCYEHRELKYYECLRMQVHRNKGRALFNERTDMPDEEMNMS